MCRCLYISVCLPACVRLCICVLSLFFMELGIDILDDSHSELVGVELGMENMYENSAHRCTCMRSSHHCFPLSIVLSLMVKMNYSEHSGRRSLLA